MLSSNKWLQGLAVGVIGCAMIPLIKSSSTITGKGTKVTETVSNPVNTQNSQTSIPNPTKIVNLLLAGNNFEDGVVAELFQYKGEDSQWKVNKVTWKGQKWNPNWTLYSDDTNGEYTFTSKTQHENRWGCWGFARYWGREKVCVAHDRVKSEYQQAWKNKFPKIKLTGWQTKFKSYGYNASSSLDRLDKCSVSIKESKAGEVSSWTIIISCEEGWLIKTLNNSDFEKLKI